MAESWEAVAHALASRLMHATAPDHNPIQPDCPYCQDYLAFARFVAKRKAMGRPWVDPLAGGRSVSLHELIPVDQRRSL